MSRADRRIFGATSKHVGNNVDMVFKISNRKKNRTLKKTKRKKTKNDGIHTSRYTMRTVKPMSLFERNPLFWIHTRTHTLQYTTRGLYVSDRRVFIFFLFHFIVFTVVTEGEKQYDLPTSLDRATERRTLGKGTILKNRRKNMFLT